LLFHLSRKENYDKDHPGMVRVTLPDFAKDGGAYILPEKDDQVIVGFLNGDPQSGIVLGSLWNLKNTLPSEIATEKNDVRAFVTKGGVISINFAGQTTIQMG
jgi:uncharacterized protein involved in type VI secretion and phage assembly